MRGRTLNDAFIILDEAQNTTSEQMKMFLTRLGFGAKSVITGDITQIDLPAGKVSGLKEAMRILSGVEAIRFIRFDHRDVVRHPIVQAIVNAYDTFESGRPGTRRPGPGPRRLGRGVRRPWRSDPPARRASRAPRPAPARERSSQSTSSESSAVDGPVGAPRGGVDGVDPRRRPPRAAGPPSPSSSAATRGCAA